MRWLGVVVLMACVSACDRVPGGDPVLACSLGRINCEGQCVYVTSDPANCGSCGNVCPTSANAQPTCTGGRCGIDCQRAFANCDGDAANGCEGRLGACNCSPGFADCKNPGDGCETPITDDRSNCGAGFNVCAPNLVCTDGKCVPCTTGVTGCGGGAGLTCCGDTCVDLMSDVSSCGACFNVCPKGVNCTDGTCFGCMPGFTLCSGACVITLSDPMNCGACGRFCQPQQHCVNGTCQ